MRKYVIPVLFFCSFSAAAEEKLSIFLTPHFGTGISATFIKPLDQWELGIEGRCGAAGTAFAYGMVGRRQEIGENLTSFIRIFVGSSFQGEPDVYNSVGFRMRNLWKPLCSKISYETGINLSKHAPPQPFLGVGYEI